jgi:polysaccharide deacetylase family protein (PEP-CTERM system associated)
LKNVLTVDVEDYFHVEAFASHIARDTWDSFDPRVERNLEEVLQLLGRHGIRGTFFVLGWVARRFPSLVREIAAAGHEIGCHSFEHQNVAKQTPAQFRADLRQARDCLAEQVQKAIVSYRAPSFSITKKTIWAIEVLREEGFAHDSSVFPVRHDVYGIPDAPRFPYRHENSLFEFPPSTIRRANMNVGVGGGGYLRLAPYAFTRWAIRQINEIEKQPAMVYFHPWEIDPGQPRIPARLRSRLRHYTQLAGMKQKLERLFSDFQFGTLGEVCQELPAYGLATTKYTPSLRYSSQMGR